MLLSVPSWAETAIESTVGEPPARQDRVADAVLRRIDGVPAGAVDPQVQALLPDIAHYRMGAWQPDSPATNLFVGQWVGGGDFTHRFLRLDITFAGLVRPPGSTAGSVQGYSGQLIGCVEIDVDASRETGGNFDNPGQNQFSNATRYLGTVARSGGLPTEPGLSNRCARDAGAFDGNINTPPLVDRSGEEFHLLFGNMQEYRVGASTLSTCPANVPKEIQITKLLEGNASGAGESVLVSGYFLHRAHGYSKFSNACCPQGGEYEPRVQLLWANDPDNGKTTVSLVYPLSNIGSAAMLNQQVQFMDGTSYNQNSVLEALDDLVFSANYADSALTNHPNWPIIAGWKFRNPTMYLNPANWRVNIVVGTTYATTTGATLPVWTDWYPDAVPGDYNGNGTMDNSDAGIFDTFMAGRTSVSVANFGSNFCLFDRNYNGVVDAADRPMVPVLYRGDFDGDTDVDMADFGLLQACLTGSNRKPPAAGCGSMDMDRDQDVDQQDLALLRACLSGSKIVPPENCRR